MPTFWLLSTFVVAVCLILQLQINLQPAIVTCGLVCAIIITTFWSCTITHCLRVIISASAVCFSVYAICCNPDSQITPSSEDFETSTIEMACLVVLKTKLICESS